MSDGLTATTSAMCGTASGNVFATAQEGLLPVTSTAEQALLALNNAHAVELSWLDGARLKLLLRQVFYARRIGNVDAFLLALDETATYDSPNYLWFRERYRRFIYVDRVAVAAQARGRGYARLLYADLFALARAAGHDLALCEINVDPPNPASDALHAALGFVEVGKAAIHDGIKTVRYFARALP
jgi:uncharacterized protein